MSWLIELSWSVTHGEGLEPVPDRRVFIGILLRFLRSTSLSLNEYSPISVLLLLQRQMSFWSAFCASKRGCVWKHSVGVLVCMEGVRWNNGLRSRSPTLYMGKTLMFVTYGNLDSGDDCIGWKRGLFLFSIIWGVFVRGMGNPTLFVLLLRLLC